MQAAFASPLRLERLVGHVAPRPAAAPAPASAGGGLKVFISVDIEYVYEQSPPHLDFPRASRVADASMTDSLAFSRGAVGITHWDEADSGHSDYGEFQDRMTQEAVAAW